MLKRCFVCRSRGELGSCKDPFDFNVTQVENVRGLSTIPCASGWCAKIVETENTLRDGKKFKQIFILQADNLKYKYIFLHELW